MCSMAQHVFHEPLFLIFCSHVCDPGHKRNKRILIWLGACPLPTSVLYFGKIVAAIVAVALLVAEIDEGPSDVTRWG